MDQVKSLQDIRTKKRRDISPKKKKKTREKASALTDFVSYSAKEKRLDFAFRSGLNPGNNLVFC